MSAVHPEEIAWASKVANQVRFLQSDFADAEPNERQMLIEEEVRRALKEIVPEKRRGYLAALSEQFPCGEGATAGIGQNKNAAEPSDNSPEALIDQMVQIAPHLPKRKLQEFGLRLQQAGYMELKTSTLVDDAPPEFRKAFGIEPDAPVDIQRVYKLLQSFAEFVVSQDKLVWNIWRALAPKSRIRRDVGAESDVRKVAGRYLSGAEEVSVMQISQAVDRLRQLVAGILTAIAPAGRGFARKYQARFSADAIKDLANMEKGGWLGSQEQKCWRKYTELTKELSEDAVETEMMESIARFAEDLMRGTGRTAEP